MACHWSWLGVIAYGMPLASVLGVIVYGMPLARARGDCLWNAAGQG